MLQGHDIVCFANDWDSDPLSKKHIMTRLARHNRVLWVNSIGCRNPRPSARDLRRALKKASDFGRGLRKMEPNLWVASPLVVPFHGSAAARWVNQRWLAGSLRRTLRHLGMRDPITWSFVPSSADVVGRLGESLIVYHCVDEFSQFTGTDAAAISAMEARLAARADLVLVSAGPLLETKRRHNPETFLVTHGVEVEHFALALDPATAVPGDLGEREQPVVGFFGLIEDWVDLDLVAALAAARPGWSFILIGKIATDVSMLRGLANVELLGWRSYRDLPRYCKGFDAALLPFRINELTLAANPLKLREYLAAGLPTVATDIPEAARLSPLVQVGRDVAELLAHLDAAVAQGSEARGRLAAAMAGETWDRKVEEMSALVERALVARGRSLGAAVDEEKERRSA